MDKKQVEQEHLKLTQDIQKNEEHIEGLNREQHQVQETFETLQFELRTNYQKLAQLNQEEIYFGGKESQKIQQQEGEQAGHVRRQLDYLQEEINQQYKKQVTQLREDNDDLQKKRGELTWD